MIVFSNLKGAVCLMGPWDVSQGSESTLKPLGKRQHMLVVNYWMYSSTQILLLLYDQE